MKFILLLLPIPLILIATAIIYLFGFRLFVITSGSMAPQLQKGDVIIAHQQDDYRIGDVIAYQNQDRVVTHQIIAKHLKQNVAAYQTKGVANQLVDDHLVEADLVIGKIVHAFPKIGLVFLLPKRVYAISLIWTMSLAVIYLELRQLIGKIKTYAR